jgi:hypothetical protein
MTHSASPTASERHNALVPVLLRHIAAEGTLSDQLVILESLAVGVLALNRQSPLHAAAYLQLLTEAAVERLEALRTNPTPQPKEPK